jgi:hypothetical protein
MRLDPEKLLDVTECALRVIPLAERDVQDFLAQLPSA